MAKGLPRTMSRGKATSQEIIKQTLRINTAISVDGATGVGFGTAVIGGFPEGNILILGAVSYVKITKDSTATGIQATFDGDYSIGSAPTADVTLSGAEVDIIPSTALGAATSGVSPNVRGSNATQVMLNNNDGSLELNLNLLIDDANISADDQLVTATGELYILYSVLGDS